MTISKPAAFTANNNSNSQKTEDWIDDEREGLNRNRDCRDSVLTIESPIHLTRSHTFSHICDVD